MPTSSNDNVFLFQTKEQGNEKYDNSGVSRNNSPSELTEDLPFLLRFLVSADKIAIFSEQLCSSKQLKLKLPKALKIAIDAVVDEYELVLTGCCQPNELSLEAAVATHRQIATYFSDSDIEILEAHYQWHLDRNSTIVQKLINQARH